MKFFDYFRLALKNLSRQKSRTLLTIVAITIGSLSLILMASLIISIKLSLSDQFKQLGAFELVTMTKDPNSTDNQSLMGTNGDTSEGKKIDNATLIAVRKLPHVVDATPVLTVNASTMKLDGQEKKTWASVVAMDPLTHVFNIPIVAGRTITASDMDKIVVGSRFLDDFNQRGHEKELIGKKVVFNSKMGGPGSGVDWGPAPEKPPVNADESWYKAQSNKGIDIEAEIVGVADNGTIGDGQNYINLAWARRLNTQVNWEWDKTAEQQNNNGDKKSNGQSYMTLVKHDSFSDQGYTSIIMKVDDTANLSKVSDAVSKLGYGAVTAQAMIDQINKIMNIVGVVLGIIAGISLFVAAIGIINTMVMATYERIREIGVMRACGATKATIRRLFTFEAAMLGFGGGLCGLIISMGLGTLAKFLATKYSANLGNIPIDRIGSFPWWLIVGVISFTTLIGLLSGLGPAIKAARLNPVEALRYE